MPEQEQHLEGDITIDKDTADRALEEDHEFDTLEDAMDALGDDDTVIDEPTDSDNLDSTSDDGLSLDAEEASDESDLEDGNDELITLDDGESVQLDELKKGYFRQKDYTHKTEALAQERKAVATLRENYDQQAQSLQTAYQNLTQFLESLIPPEPDLGLAQSDPAAFQYQTALRNSAVAEIEKVFAASEQAQSTIQAASEQDKAHVRSEEDAKLLNAMPMLKDPGRRASFDAANKKTALEFGFSEQDIESTADHRILQLVHYARIGKVAEKNRKNARRRLTEKPSKGNRSTPAPGKPPKNREAMKRLTESGTLEDAMAVDFD
ncbi:conserved hypothetical protein [Vibrio nigripulchritudo SFn27]|uniref:Uncharacterized protein n=1 Tax=Vibrio nigripulchritudo TaxID=28173 RepID=U4K5A3_9VIBR|nr:hypothetical protein [Vibrio nigripulchritudo]CCN84541.1 conserved hypothetical protein [Vibrio nigripulchritudo BLFn1]CCN88863.1 conserved hypothetical protein [Vibrio nigripulchritudo SFn27]CCN94351.1 conserved hypothetical protein [Vibrio nigripulchritudo ENn2]CCO40198.1 conserved hypothetical protein [Vibrio nigripulchritudo SFn135]CCO51535.1 conserved hypothetical protein [Vibrio nigripulchritudo Wn13]